MGLNPISTSKAIFDRFSSYATTTLKLNNEDLNNQIKNILFEEGRFSKGPIIEAIPPFKAGQSIIDLIHKNVLTDEFINFKSEELPLDRTLYKHQEEAITKISGEDRNVVVATGTGSGKTESFMIPILNHLLNEKKEKTLDPGVRAILLYPMNALANDQMKRLRSLLRNEPKITFGIYTGETEEKYTQAYDKFMRMHQKEPLDNELISREQMKYAPPNILLTNYAMLEYLMLRPDDNVFFQGEYSKKWKYIVIDEAHTYTGAKGIEMSMLISRLKNTIGLSKGNITCILTSASLGKGKEDFDKVAEFGSKLFQEEFTRDDIIEATKENLMSGDIWGSPNPEIYKKLSEIIPMDSERDVMEILRDYEVSQSVIEREFSQSHLRLKHKIFNILIGDYRINKTINLLSKGPIKLQYLAREVFEDEEEGLEYMATLIDLCNNIRRNEKDNPLIPGRYHYLIKALEGAFITFSNKPKIYLNRMNQVTDENADYKAFEVGACTRCNNMYLVGVVVTNEMDGKSYLIESDNRYFDGENGLSFFALLDNNELIELDNEDDINEDLYIGKTTFSNYKLCVNCGGINEEDGGKSCNCKNPKYTRVLKASSKDNKVHKCGICGGMNTKGSIVRRFFLAEDSVSSVLATALYNQIPNKIKNNKTSTDSENIFSFLDNIDDEGVKKQLLIFSDSRQNAAYFATYLNSSYKDILIKGILISVIEENMEECIKNNWTLFDYQRRVFRFIREKKLFQGSIESTQNETWKWIIGEFIGAGGNNTLENLGFIKFVLDFEAISKSHILFEIPFIKELGFTNDELKHYYCYLLDQFRYNRGIEYPEYVSPIDDFFAPQNLQGGFCRVMPSTSGSKLFAKGYSIRSWYPIKETYSNSRTDYLSKILKARNKDKSKAEIIRILDNIFDLFSLKQSPLHPYFKSEQLPTHGKIYKLDPQIYKITPGLGNSENKYYRCDTCFNITNYNISKVCPKYRCEGQLREIDYERKLQSNHYRKIFSNMELEKMNVSEHTAQLKTEYAAEIQNRFINGDINVLSCSTTFELGVDVGDLETVFMKNTPPTPANYAQRAGRAGRRLDSTAYALTYARLASHDFSSFSDPYKMISGVVKPPYFEVANIKIAKRHLYACALADFWRENRDYFKTVEDFFTNKEISGPNLFIEFLKSKPEKLGRMLLNVIPKELHEEIDIENWGWVEELYGENGVMTKVVNELEEDLNNLELAKKDAVEEENFGRAGSINRTINTILKRPLINYLSQKNILPKYGFPVDVVNLEINLHTDEAKNIELSRDLQIAISEYAPESQVVANGKLWTSRYVKKISKRELLRYQFTSCNCGYFRKKLKFDEKKETVCPICGNTRIKSGEFTMPEFGFITEEKAGVPGPTRPEKTYSSRKHFSGVGSLVEERRIQLGEHSISISSQNHGELTVINNGLGRGFYICKSCGYGALNNIPKTHKNSNKRDCRGRFERVALGYNFETDIIEIDFENIFRDLSIEDGFWESLMYAIIEGMSMALEIDRNDIDGTLYVKNNVTKSLILFDTVPGGAGHVKRLMDEEQFLLTLEKGLEIILECSCGGEKMDTSCYSCLRNYYNQYCHDKMKRSYAKDGLKRLLGYELAYSY